MREFTLQEYFIFQELSDYKSEFFQGEILAMPGSSHKHNVITSRIGSILDQCSLAKETNCWIYLHDMQLHVKLCRLTCYPDIMACCGSPEFLEGKENLVLMNPTIVGEVLSPSTAKYDRENKLPCYLTIPSVEIVFLAHQDEQKIEIYRKKNGWEPEIYTTGFCNLMDCEVDIERVYRNLFPKKEETTDVK